MNVRVLQPFCRWLAAFAASCFIGALATDIAYWRTADIMWSDFSDWLLTVGVIVGWVTIVLALIEAVACRSLSRAGLSWPYTIGGTVALILATVDMLVHTRDAWTSVVPWGLVLSGLVVLVVILTGWARFQIYRPAGMEVTA